MSKPSYAAKAAIEAYTDENCGDEMMPSEVQALAASLRAVALYLSNDCQELISIAYEIEHQ